MPEEMVGRLGMKPFELFSMAPMNSDIRHTHSSGVVAAA